MLHIYFLPALIVVIVAIHIWRVRKDGFAVRTGPKSRTAEGRPEAEPRRWPMSTHEPEPRYRLLGVVPREIEQRDEQEPDDAVFTWPHLLVRHVVVAARHGRPSCSCWRSCSTRR